MSTDKLVAEILRLPRDQRARLAQEVLSSLEEPEEEVALAWAEELERRSSEIHNGSLQPEDWESVKEQIVKQLELRRANRPSS